MNASRSDLEERKEGKEKRRGLERYVQRQEVEVR